MQMAVQQESRPRKNASVQKSIHNNENGLRDRFVQRFALIYPAILIKCSNLHMSTWEQQHFVGASPASEGAAQ